MQVNIDNLDDLSAGSVFLATGGGGDPYVKSLVTKRVLEKYGPVDLIDAESLEDDAFVVAIGELGAPSVSLEMLPSAKTSIETLKAFEVHVGRKIDAVVPVEIGGSNSMVPVIAAAGVGVPVVNGDSMGRAFPETQMMTFSIGGICPTPALAIDYKGNITTFSDTSPYDYERKARHLALSSSGSIIAAEHPMSGAELKRLIVPNTMSFAIEIGRILREHRSNAHNIVKPLSDLFFTSIYGEFRHIYTGKIIDRTFRTIGGYDIGEVTIQSFDQDQDPLHLDVKNEFLIARCGERNLAMTPDLIIMVDYETSQPINAERTRYGQRVSIFAIGCPPYYRTEKALSVVGPRCFGFDFDYTPLEEIDI